VGDFDGYLAQLQYDITLGIGHSVDDASNGMLLYPNPAEDQCNVMLSPASALMDLRVYDPLGRRVQVDPRKTLNGFTFRTDGLATGLYTVIASTGEGNFSGRFIKR
jgi:hypothetical protein